MNQDIYLHPLTYRKEILEPLFHLMHSGESCCVVGSASMGKTRLIDFIERVDVQTHYLGENASHIKILRMDCNRLAEVSPWGLYELLLTTLIDECDLPDRAFLLREQAVTSRDAFLAFRNLESTVQMVTRDQQKRLVFLIDEFDTLYQSIPENDLNHLRAIRDVNKKYNYGVVYILFLRGMPSDIRVQTEGESFNELISRSVLGLGTYQQEDAYRVIRQLEVRRNSQFNESVRRQIINQSGGHPGLIVSIFDYAIANNIVSSLPSQNILLEHHPIREECDRIWYGLNHREQSLLENFCRGELFTEGYQEPLILKGLLKKVNLHIEMFSPIFAQYLSTALYSNRAIWIDEKRHRIYVNGKIVDKLAPLEFKLLTFFYHNANRVVNREEIVENVYEVQEGVSNASIDALIKRLRQAIETDSKKPQFLRTVHGVGFIFYEKGEI